MKTPLHLWIIGALSLVWNAGGAYDYLMSQLEDAAYLAQMGPEGQAFLAGAPLWFEATWAIGVWFSVFGSLLLLFRSRLAQTCFGLSLLGLIASAIYRFGIAEPSMLAATPPAILAFSAVIAVVLTLLYFYARAMTRRGVLR